LAAFEKHHFDCICGSDEHNFKFSLDPDDGDFYLSVYLDQNRGFFGRIGEAVKYVFGYKSKYGHWDTTILSRSDTVRLGELCQRSVIAYDAHMNEHTPDAPDTTNAAVSANTDEKVIANLDSI
jgi:hypothetical protein